MALKITGDTVRISSALSSPSNATAAFWFRRSSQSLAAAPVIARFGSSTGRILEYEATPRIGFPAVSPANNFSVAVGDWMYLVFTKSGGTLGVYGFTDVTAETVTTIVTPAYLPTTADIFEFGDCRGPYTAGYLDGELLHARVWDSVLSTAQMNAEKNSASPVISSGLLLAASFDSALTAQTGTDFSVTVGSSYSFTSNVPSVLSGSGGGAAPEARGNPRRNRPGRGPYSVGRYYRSRLEHDRAWQIHAVDFAESGSATDAYSNTATLLATLSEAASAADTCSALATFLRSVAETGAAADSLTTTATFPRSIGTEAGSAADSVSSSVGGFDVTIAETANAVDSISALLNAGAALAETASASDTVSNIATLLAALAESVSATDAYSSTLNANNYSVSLTEAASAVDAISAQANWQRAIAEAGNATDTLSTLAAFGAALAEAIAALDAVSATGVTNVSISEAGNATDLISAPTGFGETPAGRVIHVRYGSRVIAVR